MRVSIVLLLAALAVGAGQAKPGQGKGKGHEKQAAVSHGGGQTGRPVFAASDITLIRGYYGTAALPPGIQKRLIRKGTLPPGIAKKMTPFPVDLDRQLPPLPAGYRRAYYDGWALLVHDATNVVLDVIALTRR
ncbi:MAG: hypothetical protein SFV54_06290 [Bryobacteraceae bacterium]|nr:hypothetical protein [Bryobacteraceae bacterium]